MPDFINVTFTIIMIIISIVLIINNTLKKESKFDFFDFLSIYFNSFTHLKGLIIAIPLSLLLFVPFLIKEKKIFTFIKKNIFLLIGFLSIVPIYFWIKIDTIFNYLPFLEDPSYSILVFILYLRWIILISIYGVSLLTLYLKHYIVKSNVK